MKEVLDLHNQNGIIHFNYTDIINKRRVFYISDIHINEYTKKNKKHRLNYNFSEMTRKLISGTAADNSDGTEPLLIAGDITSKYSEIDFFFKILRYRWDGPIFFVLGNHEIMALEDINNHLDQIIEKYRLICKKYDVTLLFNEVAFVYDEVTKNGEILPFFKTEILSENEINSLPDEAIVRYAEKAKMIILGTTGFSYHCKDIHPKFKKLCNAELGLYGQKVKTLYEDKCLSLRSEVVYKKIADALNQKEVIILSHTPFKEWSTLDYQSNFIYVSGHTHRNYYEYSDKVKIYSDNQVGYDGINTNLNYFYINGTFDSFINFEDGIHPITYSQYMEFNSGMNIRIKRNKNIQVYMLKRDGYYMFVYYNASKKLVLLNGGASKLLKNDIKYYYDNLTIYCKLLSQTISQYQAALENVSRIVMQLGGSGKIHGSIVDIDYNNHIFINPITGKSVIYNADDIQRRNVYPSLLSLLNDKCPRLVEKYSSSMELPMSIEKKNESLSLITKVESDKSMYKASRIVKNIQYLLYQNIVRDWNDKLLKKDSCNSILNYDELSKIEVKK